MFSMAYKPVILIHAYIIRTLTDQQSGLDKSPYNHTILSIGGD